MADRLHAYLPLFYQYSASRGTTSQHCPISSWLLHHLALRLQRQSFHPQDSCLLHCFDRRYQMETHRPASCASFHELSDLSSAWNACCIWGRNRRRASLPYVSSNVFSDWSRERIAYRKCGTCTASRRYAPVGVSSTSSCQEIACHIQPQGKHMSSQHAWSNVFCKNSDHQILWSIHRSGRCISYSSQCRSRRHPYLDPLSCQALASSGLAFVVEFTRSNQDCLRLLFSAALRGWESHHRC